MVTIFDLFDTLKADDVGRWKQNRMVELKEDG